MSNLSEANTFNGTRRYFLPPMSKFAELSLQISPKIVIAQTVIGIIANLIAFIVLCRKCFRPSSSAVYLRMLAVVDTCNLLICSTAEYWCDNGIASYLWDYFGNVFPDISIWILVLLTTERLIIVLKPFDAKVWLTVKNSTIIIIINILIIALVDSHDFWYLDRNTIALCLLIYHRGDPIGLIFNVFNSAKACYIPIPYLIISCGIIIYKIRRRRQNIGRFVAGHLKNKSNKKIDPNNTQTPVISANTNKTKDQSIQNDNTKVATVCTSENSYPIEAPKTSVTAAATAGGLEQNNGSTQMIAQKVTNKGGSDRDRGMFITLIALNICFIITRIPHDIHKYVTQGLYGYDIIALKYIYVIIFCINYMVNLFLYVGTGSKFRGELLLMIKEMREYLVGKFSKKN